MPPEEGVPAEGGQGAAQVSPPAAPPVSPPAAPPPPPAETAKPYYAEWKNPEIRGYTERKGWKDPEAIVESFMHLEKFHGVPADRLIKLPENLEDAASVKPILEKLGYSAPAEAKDYGLADMEGADPAFAGEAANWMHEIGVPAKFAKPLAERWNKYVAERVGAEEAAATEQVAVEMGALRAEWTNTYDDRLEAARRAIRIFGFTEDQLTQMEKSVGAGDMMRRFYDVGKRLGEASYVDSAKKAQGEMTPAAAQSEINRLKSDTDFGKRLLEGNTDARQRWDRLNQIASQGAQQ